MTQILVYANARSMVRLMKSLEAKEMLACALSSQSGRDSDETKVELLVLVPEYRIGEAFQTISASAG